MADRLKAKAEWLILISYYHLYTVLRLPPCPMSVSAFATPISHSDTTHLSRTRTTKSSSPPPPLVTHHPLRSVRNYSRFSQGYKPTAAKTAEEYAKLDAEDESLARWKASLGIVPGAAATGEGPKVTGIPRSKLNPVG